MHHYPRGRVEGRDKPSHYWLLWNIPDDVRSLSRGNIESIGVMGSDKDGRRTAYTPPCSPGDAVHSYTITLYALNDIPEVLGDQDDIKVDWTVMTEAIKDMTIAFSSLSFNN